MNLIDDILLNAFLDSLEEEADDIILNNYFHTIDADALLNKVFDESDLPKESLDFLDLDIITDQWSSQDIFALLNAPNINDNLTSHDNLDVLNFEDLCLSNFIDSTQVGGNLIL